MTVEEIRFGMEDEAASSAKRDMHLNRSKTQDHMIQSRIFPRPSRSVLFNPEEIDSYSTRP